MRSFIKLKYLLFLVILWVINPFRGEAQLRALQDVRRVVVTSQYVIVNGKKTETNWAINKEIYDSLGRLHTEIDWSWSDHYPHNYRWHVFEGFLKTKTFTFENEKLKQISEFEYNKDSLIVKKTIKKVIPGDTSTYLILNYTYDNQKKQVAALAKTIKGKTAYRVKSKYDLNGTEISRKVRVRGDYCPEDSIVNLTASPSYDSLGRIVSLRLITKNIHKQTTNRFIEYTYTSKNNIKTIKEYTETGTLLTHEERFYREKVNRLWYINYYDSQGKLINFIDKRYELYPTRDRKHVVLE